MVGFAGSVLAVFVLVVIIELVRRLIREYDRKIARQAASLSGALELPPSPFRPSNSTAELLPSPATASARYVRHVPPSLRLSLDTDGVPSRPTLAQQALRSTLYMIQFSATYILMLLAMSYNGYILIFGIFVRRAPCSPLGSAHNSTLAGRRVGRAFHDFGQFPQCVLTNH